VRATRNNFCSRYIPMVVGFLSFQQAVLFVYSSRQYRVHITVQMHRVTSHFDTVRIRRSPLRAPRKPGIKYALELGSYKARVEVRVVYRKIPPDRTWYRHDILRHFQSSNLGTLGRWPRRTPQQRRRDYELRNGGASSLDVPRRGAQQRLVRLHKAPNFVFGTVASGRA